MNTRPVPSLISLALLLVAVGSAFARPQEPTEEAEEPVVKLEFLADVGALRPGAEFSLAAYFELPEHHHIYWENAGESGMPTSVAVKGPAGFEIGEPRYPGPKRLEVAMGITSFVYEDRVAIFVPVKAPAELDAEAGYEFELEATWLVCREECFLQEGERALTLKVQRGDGDLLKANAAKLDPQKERLPRPRAELEELRYDWMDSAPDFRALTVVRGALEVEFFPGLESNLIVTRLVPNPGSNAYELAIDFATTPGQEEDLPLAVGVLRVVMREGPERFYSVNFSPPAK